ncbi:MAG: GNAT family N-acetyltransferase [Verrucomicrobiae bacterium]|nr:GNAT family N-acetyltransferase [Verrucomicrobiae bacterium]
MNDLVETKQPTVGVRLMAATDYPAWIIMRHALWPECPLERHRLEVEQILKGDGVVLLAEDAGRRAIGFAEVSIRRDHVEGTTSTPVPYLEGWYVVPECRGQGIGRTLVEAVAAWAVKAGFTEIASDAELNNEGSIRAHERLGFREAGRTVHFVRPLTADAAEGTVSGVPANRADVGT